MAGGGVNPFGDGQRAAACQLWAQEAMCHNGRWVSSLFEPIGSLWSVQLYASYMLYEEGVWVSVCASG